jgi:Cytochrome P460
MLLRSLTPGLCLFISTSIASLAADAKDDPAPATDRVGFPTDYAKHFTILRRTTNTADAKQVTVYGNALAASITELAALPYPNGSVLVMETMHLKPNAAGKLVEDAVLGLHVMRREAGFGADYGAQRAGEWEFVEYRPDGSYITPPPKSASCSACHQKNAGPARDFVFKARFAEAK